MDVREKLVEIVEKVLDCNKCGVVAEWLADDLIGQGVTVKDSKVVEIEQFNGWVAVTDQLPNVGCDVLILYENKSYGVGAYSDTYRDFFVGQFPVKCVTHWTYLPQPPKGE